jgi:hypothetical protein
MGWLILVALSIQLASVLLMGQLSGSVSKVALVLSYGVLIFVLAVNLRSYWAAIVALGTVMNLAVILANGGAMPVSPQALGITPEASLGVGVREMIPFSKDQILLASETRLSVLSDTIIVVTGPRRIVISPGDILIAVGLGVFACQKCIGMVLSMMGVGKPKAPAMTNRPL